jgi:hypothetical protein
MIRQTNRNEYWCALIGMKEQEERGVNIDFKVKFE